MRMLDVSVLGDSAGVADSGSKLSGCGVMAEAEEGEAAGVGESSGAGAGWLLSVETEQAGSAKSRQIINMMICFKSLPPGFYLSFLLWLCRALQK